MDFTPAFPLGRIWLQIKPSPALPVRDVLLIDFARHVAMKIPFGLGTIQADTSDLHKALKTKADEMGIPSDRHPSDAEVDALSPFAFG